MAWSITFLMSRVLLLFLMFFGQNLVAAESLISIFEPWAFTRDVAYGLIADAVALPHQKCYRMTPVASRCSQPLKDPHYAGVGTLTEPHSTHVFQSARSRRHP